LAAATAAAAASSRSFRKDTLDESMQQEVVDTLFSPSLNNQLVVLTTEYDPFSEFIKIGQFKRKDGCLFSTNA